MKILLTQGKYATIDACDARLAEYKWYAWHNGGGNWYAVRNATRGVKPSMIFLHREVLKAPRGQRVDHANGDSLDCRRKNLRFATHAQNMQNAKKRSDNKSGLVGVSWKADCRRWQAHIFSNGSHYYLGLFDTQREAGAAYCLAARRLHKEFAKELRT